MINVFCSLLWSIVLFCVPLCCLLGAASDWRYRGAGENEIRDRECESCEPPSDAVLVMMVGTVSAMWPSKLPRARPASGGCRSRHGSRQVAARSFSACGGGRKKEWRRTAASLRRCPGRRCTCAALRCCCWFLGASEISRAQYTRRSNL